MLDREKYTESDKNNQRRSEISSKLIKMGKSLIIEGKTNDDYCVISVGNLLILMSGLILDSKDISEFNNLSSMFTAKNILDDMMKSPMGGMMRDNIAKKLNGDDFGPFSDNVDDINDIVDFLKNQQSKSDDDSLDDDDDSLDDE